MGAREPYSIPGPRAGLDIETYDAAARGPNAAMYEYYAETIARETEIVSGTCLDVGCGGGYLGLALARRLPGLSLVFLDISPDGLERAARNAVQDGVAGRCRSLLADAAAIPLPESSVDLVISRGSLPFWADPVAGLREIYRVLAPGGQTFVGMGRGSVSRPGPGAISRFPVSESSQAWDPRSGFLLAAPGRVPRLDLDALMRQTEIADWSIRQGEDGRWIRMRKGSAVA